MFLRDDGVSARQPVILYFVSHAVAYLGVMHWAMVPLWQKIEKTWFRPHFVKALVAREKMVPSWNPKCVTVLMHLFWKGNDVFSIYRLMCMTWLKQWGICFVAYTPTKGTSHNQQNQSSLPSLVLGISSEMVSCMVTWTGVTDLWVSSWNFHGIMEVAYHIIDMEWKHIVICVLTFVLFCFCYQ